MQRVHVCRSPDEWNDGWSFDEWNVVWSSVGRHECCEQTYDTSASSFSFGSSDFGAQSSPKRFEWVKMNLRELQSIHFGQTSVQRELGDEGFYDWIPEGEASQCQGYDENGLPRSLNGRLADAHQVFSVLQISRAKNNKTSIWDKMVGT